MRDSMTELDTHLVDIASTVNQQSLTAGQMNQSLIDIDNLATKTVDKSQDLSDQMESTDINSMELISKLHSFKF